MEEWRQFHHDMEDLTQWISEAEDLLVDTCAPDGSLDLEKARTHQLVSASCVRRDVWEGWMLVSMWLLRYVTEVGNKSIVFFHMCIHQCSF